MARKFEDAMNRVRNGETRGYGVSSSYDDEEEKRKERSFETALKKRGSFNHFNNSSQPTTYEAPGYAARNYSTPSLMPESTNPYDIALASVTLRNATQPQRVTANGMKETYEKYGPITQSSLPIIQSQMEAEDNFRKAATRQEMLNKKPEYPTLVNLPTGKDDHSYLPGNEYSNYNSMDLALMKAYYENHKPGEQAAIDYAERMNSVVPGSGDEWLSATQSEIDRKDKVYEETGKFWDVLPQAQFNTPALNAQNNYDIAKDEWNSKLNEINYAIDSNYYNSVYNAADFDTLKNYNPEAAKTSEAQQIAAALNDDAQRNSLDQYKYIKPDEIEVFNYLLNKDGDEKALDYLSKLNLTERRTSAITDIAASAAHKDPVKASAGALAIGVFKGIGILGSAADYIAGNEIDPNAWYNLPSNIRNAVVGQVSQDIEAANEGFMGKVGSFMYGTGMSMGDFVLSLATGNEAAALAIMGAGAASDSVIEAKKRGLSDGKALAIGAIAGVAEVASEKVSIEALFNSDVKGVQYILKNALSEGGEEVESDLINTMADLIISGDKNEMNMTVQNYMAQGYSKEEAFGKMLGELAIQYSIDFAGGAVSGAAMGAVGSQVNYFNENKTGATLNNDKTAVDDIVNLGLKSKNQATVDLANKVANGEAENYELGRLYAEVNKENNITGKVVDYLMENGETQGRAEEAAYVINKYMTADISENGQSNLTTKEQAVLNKPVVQDAMNTVFTDDYQKYADNLRTADDAYSRALEMARQQRAEKMAPVTNAINTVKGVFNKNNSQNITEENEQKAEESSQKNEKTVNIPLSERAKAGAELSKFRTEVKPVNANLNDVKSVEVTPDGLSVTLNDGQKVNTHQIMDDATRYMLQRVERNFNDTQGAEDYIKAYNENVNTTVFNNAAFQMNTAGYNGVDYKTVYDKVTKDASFVANGKNIPESFLQDMYAYGKRERDRVSKEMNSKIQKVVTDSIEKFVGITSHEGGEEGQGYYDPKTNEITYGKYTKQSRIETLAHELTHMMRKHVEGNYNQIKDIVLEVLKSGGQYDQIFEDTKKTYTDLDEDGIIEEIVANSMQEMLFNKTVINELCEKKPDFAHRIWNAIKKAIAELRNVLRGHIGSTESKILSQDIEALEKAAKLYAQGLKKMSENMKNVESTEGGEIKYSQNTFHKIFAEGRDFIINEREYAKIDSRLKTNPGELIDTGERAFILDDLLVYNDEYEDEEYNKVTGIITVTVKGQKDLTVATNILQEILDYEQNRANYQGISPEEFLEHEQRAYQKTVTGKVDIVADSGSNLGWNGRNELGGKRPVRKNAGNNSKNIQNGTGNNKTSRGGKSSSVKDNLGNELTRDQQDYFKNSKVRDNKGNLKMVYHGTKADFTVFDHSKIGQLGSAEGYGFYFTDNKTKAEGYGNKTLKGYLDITNPLSLENKTLNRNEITKLLKVLDPTGDEMLTDYDATGEGYPSKAWYNKALKNAVDIIMDNNSDVDIVAEIANCIGMKETLKGIRDILSYDGFITLDKYEDGAVYVAFDSNQFKLSSNLNPSLDEDIRYSYAGLGSVNADMTSLTEAINMLEEGKSKEEVFRETGWFQGADEKWRYEISDDAMKVFPKGDAKYLNDKEYQRYEELENRFLYGDSTLSKEELKEFDDLFKKFLNRKVLTVDDVVKHDKLFDAYPFLKDIKIEFVKPDKLNGAIGSFDKSEGKILIDLYSKARPNDLKSIIIHEIQHAIQNWEHYAGGASPSLYSGIYSVIDSHNYAEYKDADFAIKRLLDKAPEEFKEKYKKLPELYFMYSASQNEKYINEAHEIEEYLETNYKDVYDEVSELEADKKFYERELEQEVTPEELYRITAGEIEARDTENRLNLSEEERKEKYPTRTSRHKVYVKETGKYLDDRQMKFSLEKPVEINSELSKDNQGRELTKAQQDYFKDSKARDDNGNLKRYYHGTPSSGFTVFENADDGISYFFTDNKNIAKSYSGVDYFENPDTPMSIDKLNEALWYFTGTSDEDGLFKENNGKIEYWELEGGELTKQKTYDSLKEAQAWVTDEYLSDAVSQGTASPSNYEVYLNAKNPYVYDARGNEWNDLKPVNFKRHFEDVEIIPVDDNKYEVDYREKGKYYHKEYTEAELDNIFGDGTGTIATIKFNSGDQYSEGNIYIGADGKVIPSNTRTLSTYAKENGYDSLVINNVHDTGSYGGTDEASQVVVVFESNQIKSVYNENPTKNEDIRYSLQDDWDFDWEAAMAESEEEKIAEGMVAQNDVNILEDGFRALKDIKDAGKVNISHNKAVQIAKRYTEKYDSATGAESLATSIEAVFAYIREHDVSYDDMLRVMRDVTLPVVENIRGDEQFTEEYRDFVKSLKGTSISLNESQKKEIAYAYGSMANFRKAVAGRFNIKEDGVNIDSLWPEIVEQSGYRLDEEENSNSQPIALLELLDQMKSDKGTVNRGMSDNQLALDMALNIYTDCFKEMSMNAAKVNEIEVAKRLAETKEILKDTVAKYEDAVDKMYKKMLADTKAQAQAEIDRLTQELRELNNIDTYNRSIDTDKRIVQLKRQIDRLKQQQEEERVYRKTSRQKARENRENSRMRNAIKSIVKDLSSRLANPNKNRYVPEDLVQATIDMLESINLDTKEGNLIKEKVQKVKDAYERLGKSTNESDASDDYDPALYNMITRLKEIFDKGKSVRRLSQSELEDVLTIAKAIQTQVKNANELIKSEIAQKIDETARGVIEDVRANRKVGNGRLEDLGNRYLNTSLNAERYFKRLVGYNEDSKMMQLYDELNEGQHKMMQIQHEVSDIFKGVLENDAEARKLTGENAKDWVDTPFKDNNGNPLKIPAGMRLSLAMHMMNEDNLKHIIYGGLTVPDMKMYNQGRKAEAYSRPMAEIKFINNEQLKDIRNLRDAAVELNDEKYTNQEREDAWAKYKDAVNKAEDQAKAKLNEIIEGMTVYERQFLESAQKYFWDYSGKQINETSMALNGYPKAMVENYFPIATDKNYTKRDIEGLKMDQTLEGWGNLKSRVHGRNPIYLENILDVISKHSNMVSKYAGLAIPIRNFNKVYNFNLEGYKGSVKQTINTQRGKTATEYIENLMTDLQGSRKADTGIFGEALGKLRGNFAGGVLTINPSVTIKQAASFPTAAAVLGWDAHNHVLLSKTGANLGLTLANPVHSMTKYTKDKMDLINQYSPLVWYRNQGNSTQELGDLKTQQTLLDKNKATKWLKSKTMNWIQNVDTTTVIALWDMAEYRVSKDTDLKKGTEEYYSEVAKWFNKAVEATQPNYTTLQRPDILRNPNEMLRNIMMFKTQPLQNLGILVDATGNLNAKTKAYKNNQTAENKAKLDEARKQFARAVSSQVVAAMVFSAMTLIAKALLHKMNPYRDDKGEITFESILEQYMKDLGSTLAGAAPGGAELYNFIMSKITDDRYYGLEVSTIEMINDLTTDFSSLYDSIKDEDADIDKIMKNAEKVIMDASGIAGIPLENIKKIYDAGKQHALDILNGEPLSFEAGYTRSAKVNNERLFEALSEGNSEKADIVLAEMENNGQEVDTNRVKEELLSGTIDDKTATEYLVDTGMSEFDSFVKVSKWELDTTSEYAGIIAAIKSEDNEKIIEAVKVYENNGYDEERLKGYSMPELIKNKYIELYSTNKTKAASLKSAILTYYQACGMSREDAAKKVDKWVE